MATHPRITRDPKILLGKPVIKGTRIAVEFVLGLLEEGGSIEEILESYPHLAREDVLACLAYARLAVEDERAHPTAAE